MGHGLRGGGAMTEAPGPSSLPENRCDAPYLGMLRVAGVALAPDRSDAPKGPRSTMRGQERAAVIMMGEKASHLVRGRDPLSVTNLPPHRKTA